MTENNIVAVAEIVTATTYEPAQLIFNKQDLISSLEMMLSGYENIVVTDYKTSKNDLASIRKLKNTIETKRKEIKNKYNQPLNQFESDIKECLLIVDKCENNIASQLSAIDEQARSEKKIIVDEIINKLLINEYNFLINKEVIIKESWLNKTTTISNIEAEVRGILMLKAKDQELELIKKAQAEAELKRIKEEAKAEAEKHMLAIDIINQSTGANLSNTDTLGLDLKEITSKAKAEAKKNMNTVIIKNIDPENLEFLLATLENFNNMCKNKFEVVCNAN